MLPALASPGAVKMKLTKGYTDRLDRIIWLVIEGTDAAHNIDLLSFEHNLLKIISHCEIMLAWIELKKKAEE
jgi:hypothetical protein